MIGLVQFPLGDISGATLGPAFPMAQQWDRENELEEFCEAPYAGGGVPTIKDSPTDDTCEHTTQYGFGPTSTDAPKKCAWRSWHCLGLRNSINNEAEPEQYNCGTPYTNCKIKDSGPA